MHLGIVLMMLGFAGAGYRQSEQALLAPGEQVEVGGFAVRHDRLSVTDDGAKEMHTAHMTVFEDGREVGELFPGRWYYRKHETEPTTEVAMRRADQRGRLRRAPRVRHERPVGDCPGDGEPAGQLDLAGLRPARVGDRHRAAAGEPLRVPGEQGAGVRGRRGVRRDDDASRAGPGPAGLAAPAHAQIGASPESYTATTPLEARLQRELVCVCGTCPHYTLLDCRCSSPPRYVTAADGSQQLVSAGAEFMRGQLREQIEAGRSEREILDYFIATYGSQEPLGAPLDEGFNRLAWLFPYLVGLVCLAAVVFIALRWSRRGRTLQLATAPASEAVDAELDARLDDELRNLD